MYQFYDVVLLFANKYALGQKNFPDRHLLNLKFKYFFKMYVADVVFV